MHRKSLVVVLATLLVLVAGVGIYAQMDNPLFLPLIRKGEPVQSANVDAQLANADLPPAPQAPHPDGLEMLPPPVEHDEVIWYSAGPETAGAVLDVAGRELRLPANVYIQSNPIAVNCDPTMECLQPPFVILKEKGTAEFEVTGIGIHLDDGTMWAPQSLPEEAQIQRLKQWSMITEKFHDKEVILAGRRVPAASVLDEVPANENAKERVQQ